MVLVQRSVLCHASFDVSKGSIGAVSLCRGHVTNDLTSIEGNPTIRQSNKARRLGDRIGDSYQLKVVWGNSFMLLKQIFWVRKRLIPACRHSWGIWLDWPNVSGSQQVVDRNPKFLSKNR